MSIKLAIYKTPAQAEKLGKNITKETSIAEAEARQIRNFYQDAADTTSKYFGAFVGVAVGLVTQTATTAFQLTAGGAAGIITSSVFKSYYNQLASKFDMITNDNPKRCIVTYRYQRLGSNDGVYWLDDIKIR